ncbi:MAG: LytTR family transcriptional regulator, partial [Bacteroidetes bacterium]
NPKVFFRVNRQVICHLQAIARIHPYFNGRLKLHLNPPEPDELTVSREKARTFRRWLEGEG